MNKTGGGKPLGPAKGFGGLGFNGLGFWVGVGLDIRVRGGVGESIPKL